MHETPAVEYLQPRARLDGPITLAAPNPGWADEYAAQRGLISDALGSVALRVEHVGSTSVPGLWAKPIIDIVLVVADPGDEAAYVPGLEAPGYALHLREPDWHEHRLLKRQTPAVNLHVFGPGSSEVARMLTFRDWLRSHPEELERYQDTKRELAARHWAHVQEYADAKTAVVEDILARAGSS